MRKDIQKLRFEASAAALRENLKRRKAQSRGRAESGPEPAPDGSAVPSGLENATSPRDTP